MKPTRLTEAQLRKAIREEIASVMDGPYDDATDKRFEICDELSHAIVTTLEKYVSVDATNLGRDDEIHERVFEYADNLVSLLAHKGYIV